MDVKHKLVLRKNETYLRDNLQVNVILPRLYEEGVISDDDRERINAEVTTRKQISKLLSIIKRKPDVYRKLLGVLEVEDCQYIKEKLESTFIDEETLRKEQESDEDFVKERLLILFRESEDGRVRYTTLEDDIRQEICLHGKEFRPEKDLLKSIVQKTFPTVQYKTVRREKLESICIFTNLTRKSSDDGETEAGIIPSDEDDYDFAEEFVKEKLLHLFQETEGKEIEFSTLETVLKRQISCHGKKIRVENIPRIVQKTFPKVVYKKAKRGKRKIHVFKNLAKKDHDSDDSDDNGGAFALSDEANPANEKNKHPPETHLDQLNVTDLCKFLEPKFLQSDISLHALEMFEKNEIGGHVFKHFEMEDLSAITDLSYGQKKSILILKDKLISDEEASQTSVPCPDVSDETKPIIRESVRKFDTSAGVLGSYRKGAILSADVHRVHNLIEPVHRFINCPDDGAQNITSWLASETITFAAACMNDRTNGTIHFGVKGVNDDIQMKGEIVGVSVDKDRCNEAIKRILREKMFEDQMEMAWKCIRPPEFIHVAESGKNLACVVVEVDVVPHAALLEDEAVFIRTNIRGNIKPTLYRFTEGSAIPAKQNEDQMRQYMKLKGRLYDHRKNQENKPKPKKIQQDLRQKFLNVFSCGEPKLTEETYPVIFTGRCDENSAKEVTENCFEFVQLLQPYAVFDFNSSTGPGSLHYYVEETKEQALKIVTTDNFDKESEENKKDAERHGRLMDDLRNSYMQTWVFANGYDRMRREDMNAFNWKQTRSQGFKEALRYCYNDIPTGRGVAIFLLLSKNYDVMLEAAEDVLSKFHGQWILLAPSDDIATNWISELIRRNSVDKTIINERCIIGMTWKQMNTMIRQVVGPLQDSACQIPLANGGFCTLRNRVKNELCDLDILSQQECDNSDILKDKVMKQKHYRDVQETFYHGGEPSWLNYWYKEDHVCRRSQHDTLMKYVRCALKGEKSDEDKVPVVTLIHQPGSGGTTTARQILWDLRKEYRCCVARRITDQTCDQILELRNYEESNSPRPPLVLLDNCDEEILVNLQSYLQRRAIEASIRSEEPIETFCVLLVCSRRTSLPRNYIKDQTVLIRQELDDQELDWFNRKAGVLKNRFEKDEGIDPKLLISFNILKENFNFSYIQSAVKQFVDGIEAQEEKDLLLFLSLINTFDIDFQPIPISAFDALMEVKRGKSKVLNFGLALQHRFANSERQWQKQISTELMVLLNISARGGQGNNLKALSIASPLFASEIFKYLQEISHKSISSILMQFLQSRVFNRQNRSVDQVIRIVNDLLMKREILDNGKKEKFSRLLTEVLQKEDTEKAVSILQKGFETTDDPRIIQHIARLYIHCKNWEKATEFAIKATQIRPNNSYFWDTYGQIFKTQLFEKYKTCMLTDDVLSVNDTCDIIQVAMKGIEKFHREQVESEHDKHASQNDAGYFGEVRLIILLVKILQCSPFEDSMLHSYIVNGQFQASAFEQINHESREVLKRLHGYTETAMRKMEEKSAQLKGTSSINIVRDKHGYLEELAALQESVDNIFGEKSDEVPAHLTQKETADFRRRRVRRLGGRSLTTLLRIRRKIGDDMQHLDIMFDHLMKNVCSSFSEPFDTIILISVAIVRRIIYLKESVTSKLPQILELSKRLYDVECSSKNGSVYMEVFLFLMMFHWPTQNRKERDLCPIGTLRDAMGRWKCAFLKKHPRQRDDRNPHRQKEATLFFLGKDLASDEIVYYEELHSRHNAVYFNRDQIWEGRNVVNKLQRLEGTLVGDGLEVLINIETRSGNIETLTVPTSMPIGRRSLWQKRVFFYLGFTWAGPKAFDVSSDDRQNLLGKSDTPKAVLPPRVRDKSAYALERGREKPTCGLDPTTKIDEIRQKLKMIEKHKSKKKKTPKQAKEISQEEDLKRELETLLQRMQDVFGN
ncbi:sterile alpha motif domain-containing protein 9-like [Mizuhopecten yessoensis]|uniref:Sterile alpha motif domain-containing protein 9-like n=1 Tax=Mizuhopecten yessoensis TaxID=6573 RepID=A0A210PEA9_MIZYE|nr:sterile alpha motif domain-containing protein 9-like [Mizuhopecten yessoensis]XP_021343872.1 sterile alpha motif domain-containing protein 9-like [Mizuhopecten yessoensis]OWF34791.1 Sterile alpha motif domain-containing protein 9-like [Mizuhopecten yessoensis]